MSRVQLALNVSDIDAAVDHYTKLFATEPAKRKPGYANFAIADPPLKLVLFENPDNAATLNHLGTEMETPEEVASTARRLADTGVDAPLSESDTCCYAVQDKAWTADPDGLNWEIYTVLDDTEAFGTGVDSQAGPDAEADVCCDGGNAGSCG